MTIELFVLPNQGGLYPRRVLIYLAEKKLLHSPHLTITATSKAPASAPGEAPHALPVLSLGGDNRFIRDSIPIIEYFEDRCDAGAWEMEMEMGGAETAVPGPTMRGRTAEERARTSELVYLVDAATTQFEVACRKGSAMFALLEKRDVAASRAAFAACRERFEVIEARYKLDERFRPRASDATTTTTTTKLDGVTVADCVLFAVLQFSRQLYGRDLADGLPTLGSFYEAFRERDSAGFGEGTFPAELRMLASHFVRDSASPFGRVLVVLDLAFVYVEMLAYFVLKRVGGLVRSIIV